MSTIRLKDIQIKKGLYDCQLEVPAEYSLAEDVQVVLSLRDSAIYIIKQTQWLTDGTLSFYVDSKELISASSIPLNRIEEEFVWNVSVIFDGNMTEKIRVGKGIFQELTDRILLMEHQKISPYFTVKDNFSLQMSNEYDSCLVYLESTYWLDNDLILEGTLIQELGKKGRCELLIKKNDQLMYTKEFSILQNRQRFSILVAKDELIKLPKGQYHFYIQVTDEEISYESQYLYLEKEKNQIMARDSEKLGLQFNNVGKVILAVDEISSLVKVKPSPVSDFFEKADRYIQRNKREKFKAIFNQYKNQPFKETTYIFESFGGRQYSDSPKVIYDELIKRKPNATIVWSIDSDFEREFKKFKIPYVIKGTKKWATAYARAQFWITNARLPLWFSKNPHTHYIQTWHGSPLKKLGVDIDKVVMPGTSTKAYKKNFVKEAAKWDLLLSPNYYSTKIFRRAFGYEGNVMEIGYPRNDKLVTENNSRYIDKKKAELGIPKDKKVVLYAPTWRDNDFIEKGKYSFELPLDIKQMKQQLGEDFVVIIRMHYLIANSMNTTDFGDFVYNLSSYSDISDLYLVSDILITDYSSVFFDYGILKRPMIFYANDLSSYKDDLRGFYLNYYQDLPGAIIQNTSDLIAELQRIAIEDYDDIRLEEFYQKYCNVDDGEAGKKVVDYLLH